MLSLKFDLDTTVHEIYASLLNLFALIVVFANHMIGISSRGIFMLT